MNSNIQETFNTDNNNSISNYIISIENSLQSVKNENFTLLNLNNNLNQKILVLSSDLDKKKIENENLISINENLQNKIIF